MSSARRSRPRAVRGILRGDRSTLGSIAERARSLATLQRRLQAALPARLRGHWQLAGVDEEAVVLVAEGPVWASQLRYHQRALLEAAARATGHRPTRCRISVEPPRLARKREPRELTASARDNLREAAAATDNPQLRSALLRLASRSRHEDS
ncbi:DciA family protein [Spiribacter halobius]|uniref:DUF721 domain-containing protein n=1 Tax=Sediminicurvatus halobius TaxID=2182432 RepID=A0A2U2N7X1_9GAMM|nr:DciA family protein [Spiribacter halobius]PWG65167.1 hypothetical protein DEM34_02510 [Spiribacter halobius]UEX78882.1 DUF721 domain-containing protein [Spiribacter halobius]